MKDKILKVVIKHLENLVFDLSEYSVVIDDLEIDKHIIATIYKYPVKGEDYLWKERLSGKIESGKIIWD